MSASLREQISEIREEILPQVEEPESESAAAEEEAEPTLGEEITEEPTEQKEETDSEVKFFNELPNAMGWDPEQFYNLKLKTDTGKEYSWSEVKDTLQNFERDKGEIAAQIEQLQQREQQLQQAAISYGQQSQVMSAEVQEASNQINQLQAHYSNVIGQIEQFEKEDDTDNLARAQSEILKIQTAYGNAQQKLQAALANQQQQQTATFQQYVAAQTQLLQQALPEWREPESRQQQQTEMRNYLANFGVSPQEIQSIADARLIVLVDKAMKWDKHQQKVRDTAQGVKDKTVRRIVRGTHPSSDSRKVATQKVIEKAQASHRERDKRDAFLAIAKDAGLVR